MTSQLEPEAAPRIDNAFQMLASMEYPRVWIGEEGKRSDLSPHEGPAARILPRLEEDFFQTLANEIMARGGDTASDSRHRRLIFRSDLAS